MKASALLLALLAVPVVAQESTERADPYAYEADFFAGSSYDPSIPTPDSIP